MSNFILSDIKKEWTWNCKPDKCDYFSSKEESVSMCFIEKQYVCESLKRDKGYIILYIKQLNVSVAIYSFYEHLLKPINYNQYWAELNE